MPKFSSPVRMSPLIDATVYQMILALQHYDGVAFSEYVRRALAFYLVVLDRQLSIPTPPRSGAEPVRQNFHLPGASYEIMRRSAAQHRLSEQEYFRRALASYALASHDAMKKILDEEQLVALN